MERTKETKRVRQTNRGRERDSKKDRETEIKGRMIRVTVRHECGKNKRNKESEADQQRKREIVRKIERQRLEGG